jgi:hypothetical protein
VTGKEKGVVFMIPGQSWWTFYTDADPDKPLPHFCSLQEAKMALAREVSQPKRDWKDWETYSELFLDGVLVAEIFEGLRGTYWCWQFCDASKQGHSCNRAEAKAALMKEVGK